jgi:tellurite methyltransferase
MNGGYDDGYSACPCFWGTEPGSFVRLLAKHFEHVSGRRVLDIGCGEGKNAAFFAQQGALVDAVDLSELAIRNGQKQWGHLTGICWRVSDARITEFQSQHYDVVVAYGLLHCLASATEVLSVLRRLQDATVSDGYLVLCAFNSRRQDLSAHPGFNPCLLSHADYLCAFSGWEIVNDSDSDLTERHPHNDIEHTHALTRLVARKRQS